MKRLPALGLVLSALLVGAGCSDGLTRPERIVLVTFDTTRADRIGCYGYEKASTPTWDGLAAEGVLFEQAVSPVPTTLPSHSTMFSGVYPHDHGVRYNLFYRLADSVNTLAETLRDAGYATAGFPATQILAKRFGLDQGFEHWVEPPKPEPGKTDAKHPVALMRSAGEGVDDALAWLGQQGSDKAFLWLHFYDPHWPYDPPFPFSSSFRGREYDGEIAYADAQFGRLLDQLKQDPLWDRTLVIVTSDHGEGLYDHGERYHSTLVYESTQRVPLVIRAPGNQVARVQEVVTLADLMPTVLDLADVAAPNEMRGVSLRGALTGKGLDRRDIYFEVLTGAINYGWSELRGIRYGPWKLIDAADPELFQLQEDPGELSNLAELETDQVDQLRQVLEDMASPLSAGAEGATLPFDASAMAAMTALGYVAGTPSETRREGAPHPRDFVDIEAELLGVQGFLAQKSFVKAAESSGYILSRDPTNLFALNALSVAMVELDRAAEALPPALKLAELNPESERAHAGLATVYRVLDDVDQAYAALERGLEEVPDSEQLLYLKLIAAFELEREGVCEGLPPALAAHPDSPRLLMVKSRCEARGGQVDQALTTLETAVAKGFRELEVLEESEDFSPLLGTERFRRLQEEVAKSGDGAAENDEEAEDAA